MRGTGQQGKGYYIKEKQGERQAMQRNTGKVKVKCETWLLKSIPSPK